MRDSTASAPPQGSTPSTDPAPVAPGLNPLVSLGGRAYHRRMGPAVEPSVLRQYRHLLRTASTDWQETAHRHALLALGPLRLRAPLLTEVQRLLLTGTRLHPDDVHAVARLLVLAERRRPRQLLDGLPPDLLDLARRGRGRQPPGRILRAGIRRAGRRRPAAPPHEPALELDHHQRWHEQRATPGKNAEGPVCFPVRLRRHRGAPRR